MSREELITSITNNFIYFMPIWRKLIYKKELPPFWREQGLNMQHLHVLTVLDTDGPTPISHAGARFLISKSDMTRITDKLEELKLIERQPSVFDRRVINIAITNDGRKLASEVKNENIQFLHEILSSSKVSELESFNNFMNKFIASKSENLQT